MWYQVDIAACSDAAGKSFFYLYIFMLLTKKLVTKIKTFLTDSQPGHVLSMLVKILVCLSLNVFIKKILIRKRVNNVNVNERAKGFTFQSFSFLQTINYT